VYHYDGTQKYEHFLQVGRLYLTLILLGLALCLPSTSVSLFVVVLYIYIYFLKIFVTFFTLTFSDLSWRDWSVTWLTKQCPSGL